jgi:hypothetical protein
METMKMADLRNRFWIGWINFKSWVRQGAALWLFVGVLVGLYLLTYNFPVERLWPENFKSGPAEFVDRVRWFGILTEVVAIGIIASELSRSVAAFNKPKLAVRFFHWIAEFRYVFIRRPPVNLSAQASLGGISLVSGVASVTIGGGTVEQQIERLKQSVAALQESLGKVSVKVEHLERDVTTKFEEEAKQRHLTEQRLNETIEQQVIGDVHIQMAGLTLLLVSIFMANAPMESSLLLRFLGLGYGTYW